MASPIINLIEENVKTSMKERNKERTLTLRLAISEFKKEEIDKKIVLTDEDALNSSKNDQTRKESISQFTDAGRTELAEKEEKKFQYQDFLPEQLGEEEIKELVTEAISATEASEPADIGKVMGALKSNINGNADMGLVSRIVKENLA